MSSRTSSTVRSRNPPQASIQVFSTPFIQSNILSPSYIKPPTVPAVAPSSPFLITSNSSSSRPIITANKFSSQANTLTEPVLCGNREVKERKKMVNVKLGGFDFKAKLWAWATGLVCLYVVSIYFVAIPFKRVRASPTHSLFFLF